MSHSDITRSIFTVDIMFQFGYFSFAFIDMKVAVQQANTCTVISPVFQPVQTFNQDGISFPGTDITYNSTHTNFLRGSKIEVFAEFVKNG
jgi:hypothetical protein